MPLFNKSKQAGPKGQTHELFLDAFATIDLNNSNTITNEELEKYAADKSILNKFPATFLHEFNTKRDKVITLREFCDKLGINFDLAQQYLARKRSSGRDMTDSTGPLISTSSSLVIPAGVKFTSDSVDEGVKRLVIDRLCKALDEVNRDSNVDVQRLDDLLGQVKSELDKQFGKDWQIVVAISQHVSRICHLPNTLLTFNYKRFAVMLWQTAHCC